MIRAVGATRGGEAVVDGRVACGHRRAAIVGCGPGRAAAPWGDDSYCWWALNEIHQPRLDRHFELHPMSVQSEADLAWLRGCPTPCYVLDVDDAVAAGVANPVRFPRDEIVAAGLRPYWTCTFAMQVALAVLEGFEEVGLFGVDLYAGTGRERTAERACVDYWIGVADGRGVRVTKPTWMAAQPYEYGYDYHREKVYHEHELERLAAVVRRETAARDAGERPSRRELAALISDMKRSVGVGVLVEYHADEDGGPRDVPVPTRDGIGLLVALDDLTDGVPIAERVVDSAEPA